MEGLEKVNYLTGSGISNNWLNILCIILFTKNCIFIKRKQATLNEMERRCGSILP